MTLAERLAEWGRVQQLRALQLDRANEELADQLAGLDAHDRVPGDLAEDGYASPADDMKRMEAEQIRRQMAANDFGARVYKSQGDVRGERLLVRRRCRESPGGPRRGSAAEPLAGLLHRGTDALRQRRSRFRRRADRRPGLNPRARARDPPAHGPHLRSRTMLSGRMTTTRQPLVYASGLSSGQTFASLVTLLAGINWPGLVVLAANLLVSYFSWQRARLEARRRGE